MHEPNFTQGKLTAIGLMSGTSMDGIDAAVLTSDGERIFTHGPVHERPYSQKERRIICAATNDAASLTARSTWPQSVIAAHQMITRTHVEAVRELLDLAGLAADEIDLVGFHGQTLIHRPQTGFTLQVGDGAQMSADLTIPVVDQFRKADVAAGGQGAPLAPLYHQALLRQSDLQMPVAVLNLGG
ncbi:MAG TPA: anhydro-N-acetylmuramic acid kinase, partial [Rhizobiales bacterium]|nr:anhydro-N-acetylmuramic acid kinase [Hyphomicrobiales bacterium]